jgi:hypothetical protein
VTDVHIIASGELVKNTILNYCDKVQGFIFAYPALPQKLRKAAFYSPKSKVYF